jgi:hypothetical protein
MFEALAELIERSEKKKEKRSGTRGGDRREVGVRAKRIDLIMLRSSRPECREGKKGAQGGQGGWEMGV